MVEPIVPQLTELFGNANLTYMFQVKDGTNMTWSAAARETTLNLKGTVRVLIDEKESVLPMDINDIIKVLPNSQVPTLG